jgi:hypothetical protein
MTIFFDTLDTKILLFEVNHMQMKKHRQIYQETANILKQNTRSNTLLSN